MEIFVARQPILDRNLRTYGYELLCRTGATGGCRNTDPVAATSSLIANTYLSIGADRILGGHKAFINFPRDLLVNGFASVMPGADMVIEVLESVAPDEEVLAACRRLKQEGFRIALDDFVRKPEKEPFLEVAHFVKVDFRVTSPADCRAMAAEFSRRGIQMIAEKLETPEEYERAREMRYTYFQGFFFAKPQVVAMREIPRNRLTGLRLLQELQRPSLDFNQVAKLAETDLSVTHKLLRYVNSAAFDFRGHIESIQHALMVLGEKEVRKVLSLALVTGLAVDKPPELTRTALSRGRLCEAIAGRSSLASRSQECFLMGMFSLLDAMIDRPMAKLARELGLAPDVQAALAGEAASDSPFTDIYWLCLACETANISVIEQLIVRLNLAACDVAAMHLEAMAWADAVLGEQ